MTWIDKEIEQQPEVIQRVVALSDDYAVIVKAIQDYNPSYVLIVARGSSDNAARYAKYIIGLHLGLPVALATPSLHTLYDVSLNLEKALVIGISQSGRSEDILTVMENASQQGALTISFTNIQESPMAQRSQFHLYLHAGRENSVAATKSYTAQLTALACLVASLKNDTQLLDELQQLPVWVQETVNQAGDSWQWVERYRYMDRFAVIGRGVNYATAFEISLKIKELCYIPCEQYSEADFLHGPIAMVDRGFPIMIVMPEGKTYGNMVNLIHTLGEKAAECLVISNNNAVSSQVQQFMTIPTMPEWLTPIVSVIPGQLFARHLSEIRGHNVDAPRGLQKVTVTR